MHPRSPKQALMQSLIPAAAIGFFSAFSSPTAVGAGANPEADAAITEKVQAALASDRRLQVKAPLEVVTQDGVVSIVGDVKTAAMVYRAVETTRNVEGVREVDTHRLDAP